MNLPPDIHCVHCHKEEEIDKSFDPRKTDPVSDLLAQGSLLDRGLLLSMVTPAGMKPDPKNPRVVVVCIAHAQSLYGTEHVKKAIAVIRKAIEVCGNDPRDLKT